MIENPVISSEFPNAETQRLFYLQALGISTYYPRFILPGAPLSQACEWPEAERSEPVVSVTTGKSPEAPASAAATQLKTAPISKPAEQARVSVTQQIHQPAAESSKAVEAGDQLQFQMVLLLAGNLAGNNVAICNQIPALAKGQLSNKEQQLLHNMLQWLGCPLQNNMGARFFSWPLPGIAGSRLLAGNSLLSFLQQARQEMAFSHLLLMGSSSLECLEEYRTANNSAKVDWEQYSTHSLAEMLALPSLKKSVFQLLLPLHARLVSGSH